MSKWNMVNYHHSWLPLPLERGVWSLPLTLSWMGSPQWFQPNSPHCMKITKFCIKLRRRYNSLQLCRQKTFPRILIVPDSSILHFQLLGILNLQNQFFSQIVDKASILHYCIYNLLVLAMQRNLLE